MTIEELEAMKARINQLEAELKAKQAAEAPAAAPAETPATSPSTPLMGIGSAGGSAPAAAAPPDTVTPFADFDWTWMNGNPRTTSCLMCTKYFTPEIRVDTNYNLDFNHPIDDTIVGSSEIFRSQEVQLEQLGLGGDFFIDNVHARFMTQLGMYSVTTPRNDGSPGRGQWNLDNAYRYISEAYGGYHWNKMHGINIDAGIFMSYVGLFSYYNFDNWAYQPSFVSSNTPWFFNGVRLQFFPTQHLKIEPWIINGWQSYGRFNSKPGLGGQIKYAGFHGKLDIISNNYGLGRDAAGNPGRSRIHTDNSVQYKIYDNPNNFIDKVSFSLTGDAGCEMGSGVGCFGSDNHKIFVAGANTVSGKPVYYQKQSFLGWMSYWRAQMKKDRYGFTIGGGQVNNPGRYLVLLPPVDGATAQTGTSYFSENPGNPYHGTDGTITWDYMPKENITFRTEYGYRYAREASWAGRGGVTPPGGSTNTSVGNGQYICTNGSPNPATGTTTYTTQAASGSATAVASGYAYTGNTGYSTSQGYNNNLDYSNSNEAGYNIGVAKATCAARTDGNNYLWMPDFRKDEQKLTFAILVKW